MNIPKFTAEDSLYKTSGHYRSGRHATNLSTQTNGATYLAVIREPVVINVPGETSHVHSCAPGWTDYGGTCFPDPLTEPSGGSGGGPGMPGPGGGGAGSGGGGGGGGVPFEKPKIDLDEPQLNGCSIKQLNSKAAKPCNKQIDYDLNNGVKNPHYFECTGSRKGKVVHPKMHCCQKHGDDVISCDDLN